jgi:hypothetical protein
MKFTQIVAGDNYRLYALDEWGRVWWWRDGQWHKLDMPETV